MNNNELTVTITDEGTVRAARADGAEAFARFDPDPVRRNLARIFVEWLAANKITKRREMEAFGALLYEMLFYKEVETLFERTRADLARGKRLRVQLSFLEDAYSLAALPWEFMYRPDTGTRPGFFLGTQKELVLSRIMPLAVGRSNLAPEEGPLKALVVISAPADLNPVLPGPVIEAMQALPDTQVVILDKPTVPNFLAKLEAVKPHVLHFMGHGLFDQTEKKGKLAFLGPDLVNSRWVNDTEFAEFFEQMQAIPHLVILHQCESAVTDYGANFAGIAPKLIRSRVPAVVASQYPITNQAAISFSRAFYRELAKGEPVDNAVQTARWYLTNELPDAYDSRVFGSPVLYMRAHDALVRSPQQPAAGAPAHG